MGRRSAGDITPGRDIVQFFRASADHLSVISPRLATNRNALHGTLTISLHRVDEIGPDGAGGLTRIIDAGPAIVTMVERADEIEDNETVDLFLDPLAKSAGQLYALCLSAAGTAQGHAPTVWLTNEAGRLPGHLDCYVGECLEPDGYGVEAALFYAPLIADFPTFILCSPITQCNLNCIHCISRSTRTNVQRLPDTIKAQIQG